MARFVFQLDGVLRHRQNVEQQRQRELAVVQAQLAKLEAELRALDAEAQATTADVRQNGLTGTLDLNFLAAHRRYMVASQKRAVEIAERMAAVQAKVDEARRALADAARERKVLEKLRERQFDAWRADLARRETAALDEVGMQLAFRKMAAGEARAAELTGEVDVQ